MSEAEGYDVLRLIEHGRTCYISSEYVEGKTLIKWLKYHPDLSKEQLFTWIQELARQLECIHKCRGGPCYRYVNPYSMIVTADRELYYLDMSAKSNEKALLTMTRRNVREHFLPSEAAYYQEESISLDIYGLGKSIQYLLSVTEPEPALTRREVRGFQKIISRSVNRDSKRAYMDMSEFRKQIPVYKEKKKYIVKKKKLVFAFLLLFIVIARAVQIKEKIGSKEKPVVFAEVEEAKSKQNEETRQTETGSDADLLKKELGFLYFLEQKDYQKAREYFVRAKSDPSAERLADLAKYMEMPKIEGREREILRILEDLEEIVKEGEVEETAESMRGNYYRCMIEGYRLLDSREGAEAVLRLGAICETETKETVRQELRGYMAYAYERTEEWQQAIELYEEMLEQETDRTVKEELYKKLVLLLEKAEKPDEAGNMCRQGIEQLEESVELRIMHIKMQCADAEIEREVCAQTIQKYIRELPEIAEEQEFQKLTREYDITMEGEQVWVGR